MSKRDNIARIIMILFMIIVSVIAVFPFYSMLVMGTYYQNDLFTGIKLLPGNFLAENWKTLMSFDIFQYYRNSVVVAVSTSLLTVAVCSLTGFAFAKYKFRFKKILFSLVLLTMLVPAQLGLVAFLIEMHTIHWIDTLFPLIIPPAASAFGAFWMTQFATSAIPDEVMESGRIDGCNEWMIFTKLALPFMLPACTTLALLSFLWSWNNFLTPLIVISNQELYTLPLAIRQLGTSFRQDAAAQILGLSVATIPILIFFIAFSKSLVGGLSAAAVKG
jgi:cellobiose transport system permease protein